MTEIHVGIDPPVELTTRVHHRHWAPSSQRYAPGDVLLAYLRNGWSLDPVVTVQTVYYSGYRCVEVFHFMLTDGQEVLEMPVVANPRIYQLIEEHRLSLLPLNATDAEFS